jgi:hypothetical protein
MNNKGLLATVVAAVGSAVALTAADTRAAVAVTFGESAPTSNIITSYEPGSQDQNAWFNDGPTENGNRLITQSFITPADSDYSLEAITMKLNLTLANSFPEERPFSIDFYRLSSPGQNPASDGTYLSSRGGYMQPTSDTATAGSYFTFDLDTPLELTAGTSYAFVLAFDSPASYQLLRLAISSGAQDPAGTTAWQNSNGGGWVDTHETYVNYIQGTAVPEPAMGGLIVAGAGLLMRRRARR